jgi:2-polyprenyl-6-methoxyphenol hydroxylase-like FAD-dependent oxidoreductase
MIPPVTGNGMSMAIEGADTAAGPLVDWSSHRQDWSLTSKLVAGQLDQTFAKRLRHARWLQHAMLDPLTQSIAWNFARIFPFFPSLLFRLTR